MVHNSADRGASRDKLFRGPAFESPSRGRSGTLRGVPVMKARILWATLLLWIVAVIAAIHARSAHAQGGEIPRFIGGAPSGNRSIPAGP